MVGRMGSARPARSSGHGVAVSGHNSAAGGSGTGPFARPFDARTFVGHAFAGHAFDARCARCAGRPSSRSLPGMWHPADMPASASRAPHTPAPVNIVVGDEELLVERAVGDLVTAARAAAGSADEHDLLAASLTPGQLAVLVSPSLFGGGCVVVIRAVQDASKDVAAELVGYAAAPAADAVLVLTHAGGAKGKALLDTLTHGGSNVVRCPKITRFAERLDFVRQGFRRAGRSAGQSGGRALVV